MKGFEVLTLLFISKNQTFGFCLPPPYTHCQKFPQVKWQNCLQMATVPKLTANELQICIIIEHPDFHLQKKDVVNKNK